MWNLALNTSTNETQSSLDDREQIRWNLKLSYFPFCSFQANACGASKRGVSTLSNWGQAQEEWGLSDRSPIRENLPKKMRELQNLEGVPLVFNRLLASICMRWNSQHLANILPRRWKRTEPNTHTRPRAVPVFARQMGNPNNSRGLEWCIFN